MRTWLSQWADPMDRALLSRVLGHLPIRSKWRAASVRTHEPAALLRRRLGAQAFDRMETFAVVRNPYDHALSYHLFMQQGSAQHRKDRFGAMSFEEGLRYRLRQLKPHDQAHMVADRKGRVLVKRLLKFESLLSDISDLQASLDLPVEPIGHLNKTHRADYQSQYSPQAKALVERLYARDFDLFPYDFDTGLPCHHGAA